MATLLVCLQYPGIFRHSRRVAQKLGIPRLGDPGDPGCPGLAMQRRPGLFQFSLWLRELAAMFDSMPVEEQEEVRPFLLATSTISAGLVQAHSPTICPALVKAVGSCLDLRKEAFRSKSAEVFHGLLLQDLLSFLISDSAIQTVLACCFSCVHVNNSHQELPWKAEE